MELKLICIILTLFGLFSSAQADVNGYEEMMKDALETYLKQTQNNSVNQIIEITGDIEIGTDFDCIPLTPTGANSVHALTPADIKVVAALGDSVTTGIGAGASNVFQMTTEYRGLSWSIGGDGDLDSVTTLPNILKKYNPDIKGFSTGTGSSNTRFNVAVSGAVAQNMPAQAQHLVDKMKADPDIDFENDWKIITLWIGGNNLCKYCQNKEYNSPEQYVESIKVALDILHDNLPRAFVNLVQIIDVTRLAPLKGGLLCTIVHRCGCPCCLDDSGDTSDASAFYQIELSQLINTGVYDTRDDFTVVIQPFFEDIELPYKDGKPDNSYFAPDCFHFSAKGHAEGAKALWLNMFEPVGSKTSGWKIGGPLYCPTEDNKYLYTSKNSPQPGLYAQGPASSNQNTEDDQHGGNQYVGIIAGTTVAVTVFIIIIIVIAMVTYKIRHHSTSVRTEKIPLIG